MGTERWELGPVVAAAEDAEDDEEETATRSQDGHIVRVVGGVMCM